MIKKYLLAVFLVILGVSLGTGCRKVEITSKNNDIDTKKKLTISTYFPNEYLEQAAKAFEKRYPDVSVTIHTYKKLGEDVQVGEGQVAPGEDLAPNNTLENYIIYLNTAFMSNAADDMLLLDALPINKYVESRYLVDLKDMIESDTDLNNENYYMNIVKKNTYDDIIYAIPIEFDYIMFGINQEVLDRSELPIDRLEGQGWNLDKMKQVVQGIPNREKKGIYLQATNGFRLFSWVFNLENEKYINLETKELKLDSTEFVELLKECKSIEEDGILYTGKQGESDVLFSGLMGQRYLLYQPKYINAEQICSYVKPLINERGEINVGSSNEIVITKDAKNKKLCWDFIKFTLSEEMQKSPELYGYAVNKKAATIKNKQEIENFVKEMNKEKIGLKVSKEEILKDLSENIDMWTSMPIIHGNTKDINETVRKEVKPFFEGKKSAEEVAKTLQDKLYVMLNE